MHWLSRSGPLVAALVLGACASASDPDDGFPMQVSGIPPVGDGGDDGGSESSSGSAGSEESGVASPFDDPEATSGSSSEGDDGGDTMADASGGICTPGPADAECTACSKASCCEELMTCSADIDCNCYMICVNSSGDVFGCGTQCGVDLFAPGPVGALVACSAGPCGASCT